MYTYTRIHIFVINNTQRHANDYVNSSRKAAAERFSNTRCARGPANFLWKSVTGRMRFINALAKFAHHWCARAAPQTISFPEFFGLARTF